jgi:hypothetical protein
MQHIPPAPFFRQPTKRRQRPPSVDSCVARTLGAAQSFTRIYPAMIGRVAGREAGDLVTVYDRTGKRFSAGLLIPRRAFRSGCFPRRRDSADLTALLDRAGFALSLLAYRYRMPSA